MGRLRVAAKRCLPVVPLDGSGVVVAADLRTAFGQGLYRRPGSFRDPDLDVLPRFLRPGDVFLDCGANIGLFSLAAARLVGDAGQVIAFEPAPDTRLTLLRNVVVNSASQVTVLPYALSDHVGWADFVVMGRNGGLSSFAPEKPSEGRTVAVELAVLDDLLPTALLDRVTMMKVDVEGAEAALLQGAAHLLERVRPAILIEVEDEHLRRQGSSADALRQMLEASGYVGTPTRGDSPNVLFTHASAAGPRSR